MKTLILLIALILTGPLYAQDSGWRDSARNFFNKVMGVELTNKILGVPGKPSSSLELPEIPAKVRAATDVSSYSKLTKEETEFDSLPSERKRQFDYVFIEELFQETRKSEARDEDLAGWLNTLDQGGSREGVYQALVLDEVYAALEDLDENPSNKLINFILEMSSTYFNQSYKEESLNKLNLYSLKRVFTEKGLDLLEYFETKDLDSLYRWYALYSADLADKYSDSLSSILRKDSSPEVHYEWAKKMPIQHIKSEFIIKTHAVMNRLQD